MAASLASEEFMNEKMEVELTPMIDVAFLILIFFMCLPFKTLDGEGPQPDSREAARAVLDQDSHRGPQGDAA